MEFQPYEYQKMCIHQVMEKPACALWLDMGLGKTMISLMAINELRYNRFEIGKVLVIAPKKVAEATWQDEAAGGITRSTCGFLPCLAVRASVFRHYARLLTSTRLTVTM